MRDPSGDVDSLTCLPDSQIFDELLQAVNDVVWSSSLDGAEILYLNRAVEQVYGRPIEQFRSNPRLWLEVTHPEDRPSVEQRFHSLLTGKEPSVTLQYRIVRPDGEVRWIEDRTSLIYNKQGKPVRMGGIVTDVTDRLRDEQAQRNAHEELQRVLNSIHDYVWSADITPQGEWKYRYTSPAVEKIFGLSPQTVHTGPDHCLQTVHVEDRPRLREIVEKLSKGQLLQDEFTYRTVHPDGTVRWARGRITLVATGDGSYRADGVVSDITEQMRQKESLAQSERLYRLLATHSTDIISIFSPEGDCQYISPACRTLLGFEPEELIGTNAYDFFYPEDHTIARSVHEQVLSDADAKVQTGSWRVRCKDGKYVWLESTTRAIVNPDTGQVEQILGVSRDVTSRREVEAQLRFQSQLLESVRESVIATDLAGQVIYWGKGAETLYGYSADEVLGQPIDQIRRFANAEAERMRMEHVLRAGEWNGQSMQRRKDGSQFWADTFISLIRDAQGTPAGVIGIDRDVTERRQTEEQLQARTQELQAITENAPALIARLDRDQRHLYVSRAYAEATAIAPPGYVGKTCRELDLPTPFCDVWEHHVQQVLQTGRAVEMEFELGPSTNRRYFKALVAPETRRGANVETVVVIARDLTDQRQVDQQLKEAEMRFEAFMEHTPTAAFIKDAAGRYVYCNQAATQFFQRSAEEILGRTDRELCPPQMADVLQENDAPVLKLGVTRDQLEAIVGPDSNQLRHFWAVKFPLNDAAGNRYVGGVAIDMTDRKRAEEELQQHQATLAHVARLSTMGEMVAGIAHEIAQPLSAISNFAAASKRTMNMEGGDHDKVRHWIELIGTQSQRAGDIIDRLRRFVRGSEPQRIECRLLDLTQDSIKLVTTELNRYRAVVRVIAEDAQACVLADEVQIQQVIVNLLRNACEAMQETPLGEREISVYLTRRGREVEAQIRDNGSGLPKEDFDKVLDAFFTTKPGGMGMGLAVSRRIIDAHGGRLWATPAECRGTIFHFTLPRQGEEMQ